METITIKLDFGNGPIWKECVDLETGELSTGVDVIDEDNELRELDEMAQDIYIALYKYDDDGSLTFDEARESEVKYELVDIIARIKSRLEQINDGSFIVEDEETERLLTP